MDKERKRRGRRGAGHIRQRAGGSWSIVFWTDDGTGKRRQVWETVKGTRTQAQNVLNKRLTEVSEGAFIPRVKMTFGEWLDEWLKGQQQRVDVASLAEGSYRMYGKAVAHLKRALGHHQLQGLKVGHLRDYFRGFRLAPTTGQGHSAILYMALQQAVEDEKIRINPATKLRKGDRPTVSRELDLKVHCWDEMEARRFVDTVKAAAIAQWTTLYCFLLQTGVRKSEAFGLAWNRLDLDKKLVTIDRQLRHGGTNPTYGPTKTKKARTIVLPDDLVNLLREHRRVQNELKMQYRTTYQDHGLVFAREDPTSALFGCPVNPSTVRSKFIQLQKKAGVHQIRIHDLRHTSISLDLASGTPVNDVAERVGDKPSLVLDVYAHAQPKTGRAAADRLSAVFHG